MTQPQDACETNKVKNTEKPILELACWCRKNQDPLAVFFEMYPLKIPNVEGRKQQMLRGKCDARSS